MKPKEKAIELISKMDNVVGGGNYDSKEYALIAVDEIIKSEKLDYLFSKEEINSMEFTSDSMWVYERFSSYWEKVKEEINKL